MPIVRRRNALDAKVVPRWLQLRNRWIILFRIGYAKNRTRALWWSATEAGGLDPSLPFIHRHRSEGPSNLRIDTPSLHSFKTPGALLPRDIERVMCLYLRVKHASCGQADLIWESGRKPVPHRRKPKN